MADFVDITFYDKLLADATFLKKPTTAGTAGQALVLNADGTALIWATPVSSGSGSGSGSFDGGTQFDSTSLNNSGSSGFDGGTQY